MIDAKELEKQKTEQRKDKIVEKFLTFSSFFCVISTLIIIGFFVSRLFIFLIPELDEYSFECYIFFAVVVILVVALSIFYRLRHMSKEDAEKIIIEIDKKVEESQKKMEDLKYQEYTRKAAKNCKRYINSNGL